MDDLIEALQIFRRYTNAKWPTHCEHDVLYICGIEPDEVADDDKAKLEELGFNIGEPYGGDHGFYSDRFGSA